MDRESFIDPQPARRVPIYAHTHDVRVYRLVDRSAKAHSALMWMGAAFVLVGIVLFGLALRPSAPKQEAQPAAIAPAVYVGREDTHKASAVLSYGPQPALAKPDFYAETLSAFVVKKLSFIAADLSKMELTVYEDGVIVDSTPIAAKGKIGSWWETPAGLYKIESKEPSHFSTFGHVYQPWSMAFQGNFFIHGWPHDANNVPVSGTYSGGCIRLKDDDAKRIYDHAVVGMPVLVYQSEAANDGFHYEIPAPEVTAEAYLVADVKSGDVLTAHEPEVKRPIASVTKLITALVAGDHINLDKKITIGPESLASTTVPRLATVPAASAYALLFPLLLESSNEAAYALANYVGLERFVALMNEKARALGMRSTTFTDPEGLDEGNVSTPADLFLLAQHLYNNRQFVLNISAAKPVANAAPQKEFTNLHDFNKIDGIDDFIGGKIGDTNAAGQTALQLFTVKAGGEERVIAIALLHSEDRSGDMKKLIAYVSHLYDVSLFSESAKVTLRE